MLSQYQKWVSVTCMVTRGLGLTVPYFSPALEGLLCELPLRLMEAVPTSATSAAVGAIPVQSMTAHASGGINPACLTTEITTGSQVIHVPKWLNSHSASTRIISGARIQNEFLLFRLLPTFLLPVLPPPGKDQSVSMILHFKDFDSRASVTSGKRQRIHSYSWFSLEKFLWVIAALIQNHID